MGRTGIEQYLYMMDQAFEAQAGWHSLMKNLGSVRDDDWLWVPDGAKRCIKEIAMHLSARLMYENHGFGDGSYTWETLPSIPWESSPAEIVAWLRECQAKWRGSVAALDDDAELLRPRRVFWGGEIETRWIINLMIQHDLYHAGEINFIRALRQGDDA